MLECRCGSDSVDFVKMQPTPRSIFLNAGMLDCPASDYGSKMKKERLQNQSRLDRVDLSCQGRRNAPELDREAGYVGVSTPAASASMPMPS
jgi:hypothetical protein